MATKKQLQEVYGDGITEIDIVRRLANRLNPAGVEETVSRGWRWKLDLWKQILTDEGRVTWATNKKTKFDLYEELGKAPGTAVYKPGPVQQRAHECDCNTKQFSGGWRAGKSKWLAAEILPYLFRDSARVWIVASDYIQAREEFTYLLQWLRWLDCPITRLSQQQQGRWALELEWGALLETQTGDDESKIEAANLDCAAVAEAGLIPRTTVNRLRGRVMEKGGPVLMSGSLDKSQAWYTDMFEEYINGPTEELSWHAFGMPSWENLIMFPDGESDEKILEQKAVMSDEEFKLKIVCQPAKPTELVFPEFDKSTHVVNFDFSGLDKDGFKLEYPEAVMDELGVRVIGWRLPTRGEITLAIDPGFNGAYAVLACRKYDENVFVIDEVYARRWIAQDVIAECKTRDWWTQVAYAVMDIAGKQHQAMQSHLDIWSQSDALGFRAATNYVPIPDGIHKLKTWLRSPLNGRPRVWFSRNCQHTIGEFGKYRYRMTKDDRPEREEPIDKDNHSIKALEYLLIDRYGVADGPRRVRSESYIKHRNTADHYAFTGNAYAWWMN